MDQDPPTALRQGRVSFAIKLFLLFFNFTGAQRGMWRLPWAPPEPLIPMEHLETSPDMAENLCWLAAWLREDKA